MASTTPIEYEGLWLFRHPSTPVLRPKVHEIQKCQMILGFSTDFNIDCKRPNSRRLSRKSVSRKSTHVCKPPRRFILEFYVYYSCVVIATSADNPISRRNHQQLHNPSLLTIRLELEHSFHPPRRLCDQRSLCRNLEKWIPYTN